MRHVRVKSGDGFSEYRLRNGEWEYYSRMDAQWDSSMGFTPQVEDVGSAWRLAAYMTIQRIKNLFG